MVLKIVADPRPGRPAASLAFGGERVTRVPVLDRPPSFDLVTAMGAALVPVLFAYGGWQTRASWRASCAGRERDLPRALAARRRRRHRPLPRR